MQIDKVYLGYWYQRTTLHLSEMYDFLKFADSPLELNKKKLEKFRQGLKIRDVEMKIGNFERIELTTTGGIEVKIYEDGLVIFEKKATKEVAKDIKALNTYFEEHFSPAQSYLYSLGAPIPKELAGIKTISPFFIVTHRGTKKRIEYLLKSLKVGKYYEIKSKGLDVYRGGQYFVINSSEKVQNIDQLVEMQIFFREFKVQLHRYLNLHRIIWEEIAEVKENKQIKGRDVGPLRNQLESYKKTVELIDGRINQMGVHMKVRENIIKDLGWDEFLSDVLEFKYETLGSTLSYIKTLWGMTKNYVDAAIQVFAEIQASSTKDSVRALTLITTIGVLSGVIGFLKVTEFPELSEVGIIYFAMLLAATWLANKGVGLFYRNVKYKIKDIEVAKNIK